jgi:cytochrome c553
MKRKRTWLIAALAAAFAGQAGAADENVAPDARKPYAMCQGCHGIQGYRVAFPEVYHVPKLGGQHPAYILKALHAYKSGTRNNASMQAIAASLSEEEMKALAAYYSGQDAQTTASK